METTEALKHVTLEHIHQQLGAKIVPFAGYAMPVTYEGLNQEHLTVRTAVGVFDVSHMGEFFIKGPQAFELVQRLTTNDVSLLNPGRVQYSAFTNMNGGIIDDLLVYCIHQEEYMLVVNASNIEKDWNWVVENNVHQAKIENHSDHLSLLAIQGPKAILALQKLTPINLSEIPYYHFKIGEFAGFQNIILSNTGYTGAGGFEIYAPNKQIEQIWHAIFNAGAEFGIKPIGLGARDTLRLEMGFCLYGHEINDTTTPLEAGLGWITKLAKPFNASDILVKQKQIGVTKKLVGFEMIDRGIPRQGYAIGDGQGNVYGEVTSGTQSPSLGKAIGMGYVPIAYAKEGSEIFITIRDKFLKAKVVKIPFYTNPS